MLTIVFAIIGFVVFLFIGVLIAGEFWPEQPYETGLSYLLGIAIIGAVLCGGFTRRMFLKRSLN